MLVSLFVPRTLQARADKVADCLHEMRQIGTQPVEARQAVQCALVHVERTVDFDLEAVAILARTALPAHDLYPFVALVDAHVIAEPPQKARDELGEFRCASRAVAVAEHKVAMLVARAAIGRHRMTIDVPNRTEFGMQPIASLVQDLMVRGVVALDARENVIGAELAVIDRDAGPRSEEHTSELQ